VLAEDMPLIGDEVTLEQLLAHRSGISDYLDEDADHAITDYLMPVPVQELATIEQYQRHFIPPACRSDEAFPQCHNVPEGRSCLLHRSCDDNDPVEAGGMKEAVQRCPWAGHRHFAAELSHASGPADEGAQHGRVDERHVGEFDDELGGRCQGNERLAEVGHAEGVEVTDRAADGAGSYLLGLDVEHLSSHV
jgi:hypothetical protein